MSIQVAVAIAIFLFCVFALAVSLFIYFKYIRTIQESTSVEGGSVGGDSIGGNVGDVGTSAGLTNGGETISISTEYPTMSPTMSPATEYPTMSPTLSPATEYPTMSPTISPTISPTVSPTVSPMTESTPAAVSESTPKIVPESVVSPVVIEPTQVSTPSEPLIKTYEEYEKMMNISPRVVTKEEWDYISLDLVNNGYDQLTYEEYLNEIK